MDRPTTGAQRAVSPAGRARPVPADRRAAATGPATPRPAVSSPGNPAPAARPAAQSAREAAALRARRVAVAEQRAAAAKRRLALTLTLMAASAIAWTAVSAFSIHVGVPAVLTAMLGGVLVLGRRAVVAGRRVDAATVQQRPSRPTAERPKRATVTGRAVHGSEASTQMISSDAVRAAVAGTTEVAAPETVVAAPAATVAADAAESAQPVAAPADMESEAAPVEVGSSVVTPAPATVVEEGGELAGFSLPRPTYTMKASAPRREPAPLDEADVTTPSNASERASSASAASAEEPSSTSTEGLGLDLDAILARRRASGQ